MKGSAGEEAQQWNILLTARQSVNELRPFESTLASATGVESEYHTWPSNSILRYIPYVQPDTLTKLFIAHPFLEKIPKYP